MEKKSCFIIMPFSSARANNQDIDADTLDYVYENIIAKAVSEFEMKGKKVFHSVSRYNSKVGSIVTGIADKLNTSDLVIADLTGLNPNVMYELGVRHTLKRGTIIITQEIASIPSDLRDFMCVPYRYSDKTKEQLSNYQEFRNHLHNTISELFTTTKYDSPVLSYLKGREQYWREDEIKRLKENIIVINYILEQYEEGKKVIQNPGGGEVPTILKQLVPIVNNLQGALADLNISAESAILYDNIQAAKSLFADVLKSTATTDYFHKLGSLIPAGDNPFEAFIQSGLQFYNYFYLEEGDRLEISLSDVFNDEFDFYTEFIVELTKYADSKAVELGINKQDIDYMLVH